MKNRFLVIAIVLCSVLSSYGQQDPHYTQYMYNMSVVNPAYVLDEPGKIQIGSLYRMQWIGLKGGPRTANVFGHYSINNNVEVSVNYINDRIGNYTVFNQNLLNVDFAYKLKLTEQLKISLGLKAGINHQGLDFSNSNLQATDPAFQNTNEINGLLGAGVFLFHDKYYMGISSPNLLPSELATKEGDLYETDSHINVIGGYVFDISRAVKLKPSTVFKVVDGAPVNFDVSVNTLINDKFELGVSYRYQDAVAAMFGFYITPSLRLGYAYDYNLNELNNFNDGSHEIILVYDFNLIGLSKKYLSPRFY